MLASAPLRSAQRFGWLPYLKAAQLQRIARATGIQSSGTKGVLIERIENVLGRHWEEGRRVPGDADSRSHSDLKKEHGSVNSSGSGNGKCSILSIDMGIRNLAFAHFHLAQHPSATSQTNIIPQLTAWRRLAVSEMGDKSLHGPVVTDTIEKTLKEDDDVTVPTSRRKSQDTSEYSFSPSGYATMAYNLITSLLDTYRPTHILIERQRFRSGGGSAVQEWTLRVGIFEGMLYAILHALRHERGGKTAQISVQGIEPKRVVGYWMDKDEIPRENESGGASSAREVKKAKIDLVGRWLEASTGGKQGMISLQPDGEASEIASTYLRKLKTPNTRKKDPGTAEMGKLDDLADCLLQGVTWMAWQKMRANVAVKETATLESLLGQEEWERAQGRVSKYDYD